MFATVRNMINTHYKLFIFLAIICTNLIINEMLLTSMDDIGIDVSLLSDNCNQKFILCHKLLNTSNIIIKYCMIFWLLLLFSNTQIKKNIGSGVEYELIIITIYFHSIILFIDVNDLHILDYNCTKILEITTSFYTVSLILALLSMIFSLSIVIVLFIFIGRAITNKLYDSVKNM